MINPTNAVLRIVRPATPATQSVGKQLLSISSESFWKIRSLDKSGHALTLYMFYVQKCIDDNSPQPFATDEYCAERLDISLNTIRKSRKQLESIGLVKLIRKRRKNYIRVNYLPFRLEGPSVSLSTDKIPAGAMGTAAVFDYFATWNERILERPQPFINAVNKRLQTTAKHDDIVSTLTGIIDSRIDVKGYGIDKLDTELRYFYYLVSSVADKITRKACA